MVLLDMPVWMKIYFSCKKNIHLLTVLWSSILVLCQRATSVQMSVGKLQQNTLESSRGSPIPLSLHGQQNHRIIESPNHRLIESLNHVIIE